MMMVVFRTNAIVCRVLWNKCIHTFRLGTRTSDRETEIGKRQGDIDIWGKARVRITHIHQRVVEMWFWSGVGKRRHESRHRPARCISHGGLWELIPLWSDVKPARYRSERSVPGRTLKLTDSLSVDLWTLHWCQKVLSLGKYTLPVHVVHSPLQLSERSTVLLRGWI